ncbi:hypothetical protein [Sphingomonas sp. BE137]|uniref:hypothetical protein n=1 Tax=Sphingomonas sp. BE137 TaxID=2817844 RepID=UPI001AE3F556|nr:hypothetical protein [Sphingomonas sp. BE137]MDR6850154.1 hypothetical protein [Sphingomonas sp. BE137]
MSEVTSGVVELAERVERGTGISNRLDAEIEIALFNPPEDGFVSVRKNRSGSKLIYTQQDGREVTHWPADWTMDRSRAAALLRACALSLPSPTEEAPAAAGLTAMTQAEDEARGMV